MKDKVFTKTTQNFSHIKEVKETKNIKEVNKLVKLNWEILTATSYNSTAYNPSATEIANGVDSNVLFILGRSN